MNESTRKGVVPVGDVYINLDPDEHSFPVQMHTYIGNKSANRIIMRMTAEEAVMIGTRLLRAAQMLAGGVIKGTPEPARSSDNGKPARKQTRPYRHGMGKDCKEWLRRHLHDGAEHWTSEVFVEAKRAGFTRQQVLGISRTMRIEKQRRGIYGAIWRLKGVHRPQEGASDGEQQPDGVVPEMQPQA